jgi:hypothetical protein
VAAGGVLVGGALVVWRRADGATSRRLAGAVVLVVVVLSLPTLAATGTWLATGQPGALTELEGGAFTVGSTFESQTAEGWTARDGATTVVSTDPATGRYGLFVAGTARRTYDTRNHIAARQVVMVAVERGTPTIRVAVDRTPVARTTVTATARLTIPDSSRVTVTVEGGGSVIESVAVATARRGGRL